jgi:hypothetical protein
MDWWRLRPRVQIGPLYANFARANADAMLLALTLDYPYSGSIAVSGAPFKAATLLLLSGT